MKLRNVLPVLGLASALLVGCARSTLSASAESDANLAEKAATSDCCAAQQAVEPTCTKEKAAGCDKPCPSTDEQKSDS